MEVLQLEPVEMKRNRVASGLGGEGCALGLVGRRSEAVNGIQWGCHG